MKSFKIYIENEFKDIARKWHSTKVDNAHLINESWCRKIAEAFADPVINETAMAFIMSNQDEEKKVASLMPPVKIIGTIVNKDESFINKVDVIVTGVIVDKNAIDMTDASFRITKNPDLSYINIIMPPFLYDRASVLLLSSTIQHEAQHAIDFLQNKIKKEHIVNHINMQQYYASIEESRAYVTQLKLLIKTIMRELDINYLDAINALKFILLEDKKRIVQMEPYGMKVIKNFLRIISETPDFINEDIGNYNKIKVIKDKVIVEKFKKWVKDFAHFLENKFKFDDYVI